MKGGAYSLTLVEREDRDGEPEFRPLSLALIRRLLTFTRPYARQRNLLILIVIARSIQLPLLAWAIGAVIGGPVARLDLAGVLLGAAGYGVLAALTQFTMRYRMRLSLELGEQVIHDLRRDMFIHLQRQPMRFYHRTKVGRIISRFTTDAEAVRVGVQDVLFVSLVQGGQMVVAAGFMIGYDWVLFLVVAGMVPGVWGLNRYFRRRLSAAYRAVQESFSRITATLAESVTGIRVTQGFARENVNAGLFHELVADHSRYNIDAARTAGIFVPILEFNTQFFIACILLVGGARVLHGHARVEDLYQFVLMAGMLYGPIQALANQYNHALAAMAGAERVFKFLDTRPGWTEPADAADLPDAKGRVDFVDVTFGYDPDRPVLRDVSFSAEPGTTVALVGPTGSGKTTIVNLLERFYLPARGEVRLDGRDIRTLRDPSLHAVMSLVLQQNFLFSGTVVDNIRVGRPSASEEDILAAAGTLDCRDLVEGLPEGLRTVVGEGGSGLSLGQRQVICFLRALVADPRVLILDEATSSVDALTEARLQKAMDVLLRNRTSIVIAHRLSTVRHADLVLVLNEGRIVERGTHEELLLRQGLYARMYRDFVPSAD